MLCSTQSLNFSVVMHVRLPGVGFSPVCMCLILAGSTEEKLLKLKMKPRITCQQCAAVDLDFFFFFWKKKRKSNECFFHVPIRKDYFFLLSDMECQAFRGTNCPSLPVSQP